MLTDVQLPAHLEPLLRFGDDDTLRRPPEGWRNYVSELSLTGADASALLTLLNQWVRIVTDADDDEGKFEASWAAPIHAWRALGQIGAVEAVAPMLAQTDSLDEVMDDWSMSDWPHVFGMIGPAAVGPLLDHAADASHREFARTVAIDGLERIIERNPESRDAVVESVTKQLAQHEIAPIVNATRAGLLVKLHAVETAEVIERAFAADVIDESMYGHWAEMREQLGVAGLGLAPLERRAHWWPVYGLENHRFDPPHDPFRHDRDRQKAKREKAKRKAAAQAKKRNRRAK